MSAVISGATTEERKQTRAKAIRDMVEIRLATNEDGEAIATVLKENGIELAQADWSKVFPHWLIAGVDEEVVGCCQLAISQPVGYVEFMFVRPSAPFKLRAIALRKLMMQSILTLKAAGCSYVGGIVSQSNRKFADVIGKLGFVKAFPADLYAKKLK